MGTLAYYNLPTDNVAANATWMAEASVDTNYPASNIPLMTDLNRGNPGKLTIATTGGFLADFGGAQPIAIVVAWHNMDASQKLQVQGNATSNFATPTFSTTLIAPAKREDGFTYKIFADLTITTGYSSGGFRWWRFHYPATAAANSTNWGLKVWMGTTIRTMNRPLVNETHLMERHQYLSMTTDFGYAWRYDLQSAPRMLSGNVPLSQSGLDSLFTWYRSAGGPVTPILYIPDGAVNDAWLARFGANIGEGLGLDALDVTLYTCQYNPVTISLEEITAGGPEWT